MQAGSGGLSKPGGSTGHWTRPGLEVEYEFGILKRLFFFFSKGSLNTKVGIIHEWILLLCKNRLDRPFPSPVTFQMWNQIQDSRTCLSINHSTTSYTT